MEDFVAISGCCAPSWAGSSSFLLLLGGAIVSSMCEGLLRARFKKCGQLRRVSFPLLQRGLLVRGVVAEVVWWTVVSIADNSSCVRSRRWLRAIEIERVVVASQKLGADGWIEGWMQMQRQCGSEWTSDQRPAGERRAL